MDLIVALEHARQRLPDGWHLSINIVDGRVYIELIDPDGLPVYMDKSMPDFVRQVNHAVERAIEDHAKGVC